MELDAVPQKVDVQGECLEYTKELCTQGVPSYWQLAHSSLQQQERNSKPAFKSFDLSS